MLPGALNATLFGTCIGRYRGEYADEKELQSDGNMPSLPEQETPGETGAHEHRFFASSGKPLAAVDAVRHNAVRHNGRHVEADSVRRTPSSRLDIRAQGHRDRSAGHA